MRFSWIIPVLVLALAACGDQPEKKPDYLLNEDKMVSIMVDLHLIETAHNLKIMDLDTNNIEYEQFMASVFLSNEATKQQFDSSLFYYSTRTEEMNVIYDKVLERLSELESRVNSESN